MLTIRDTIGMDFKFPNDSIIAGYHIHFAENFFNASLLIVQSRSDFFQRFIILAFHDKERSLHYCIPDDVDIP